MVLRGAAIMSFVLGVAGVLGGCASAASEPPGGGGGDAGFTGFFGGGGFSGSGGAGGFGASGSGGTSGAGGVGASGGSANGGSGGIGGVGGSAASGGTGAVGGSGGSACPVDNSCATAEDLGTLSGDSGTPSVERSVFGSHFFKVRVTEDNHSVFGQALKVAVALDPPNDADYDAYAYVNPATDSSPCGTAPFDKGDAFGIGQNESFNMTWGDGLTGSGNDDSRTVVVEVKHKTGACSASATYKLTIAGNK